MSQLIFGRAIRNEISALVQDGQTVRIAAPYWSAKAIEALGIGKKKLANNLEIICDLFATTTSPEIIQELLKRGATVRINRDLHAKVYFNGKAAIIGSANVSGPAFGLKGSDLQHEMCTRINNRKSLKELASWWADRWEESTPLDPNTPDGAQLLEHASYLRTVEAKAMDLWAAVAREPSNFKDVYLALDWHSYGKKVAESVKQKQAAEPSLEVDAWEDWPDMPARAELMSFWSARGKGPVDYRFNWRSPDKVTLDEHNATYVTRLSGVRGYRFVFDDRMKEAVTKWRDKLMAEGATDGGCIKLVAFARKYLSLKF